jgi:hypothetical protein
MTKKNLIYKKKNNNSFSLLTQSVDLRLMVDPKLEKYFFKFFVLNKWKKNDEEVI